MIIIKKGSKFGRWTVISKPVFKIEYWKNVKYNRPYYLLKCTCGNIKKLVDYTFVYGNSKSCGCLAKEMARKKFTTHGMRHTRFYRVYTAIGGRCGKQKRYIDIKCLWKSFEDFRDDMYKSYLQHVKK